MQYVLLLLLIFIAVLTDIRYGKIPNLLIITGIVAGFSMNIYNFGLKGLLYGGIGLVCGLLLLIIPFAAGWIGAGDVKLLGAIGAFQGGWFVFYTTLYSAVWGGILAVLLLVYYKRTQLLNWTGCLIKELFCLVRMGGNYKPNVGPMPSSNLTMPYAIPICLGCITTLLFGAVVS